MLDAAMARWSAGQPDTYTFDFNWGCFCFYEVDTVRITVEGDEIVRVIDPVTGSEVGDQRSPTPFTVDGLFQLVQRTLDKPGGAVAALEFERDLGYPVKISLDQIVAAIDDEAYIRVSNFRLGAEVIDLDELRRRLDLAQFLWFESGPQSYEFTFRWQCFCPPPANQPVRIRVEGGQIVSVTDAETGEGVTAPGGLEYQTVPELFGWISRLLNNNPEFAELVFDDETGYPKVARFDPIRLAVDEEQAFFIESFELLDLHTELQERLDAARAAWDAANLRNYRFEFNWQCFCVQDFVARMAIQVDNGRVTSVTRLEDGQPVDEQFKDSFVTIDELFDRLQEAIDQGAASIRADFDPDSGVPTGVFIDYQAMMADEEMGWNAGELEPLPAHS